MYRAIIGTLLFCGTCALSAQTVVKPTVKVKDTSFAIIVDQHTYQACEADLKAYQTVLGEEGLPAFIVYNQWNTPEEVKEVIAKLYRKKKLEGVVLVGDIPIPMIRKAQHLTSAFKMDEQKFGMRESSVPSDRFYDDLDLQFDFIKQDSLEKQFFYYDLGIESPQQIQCDLYSARVKAVDNGEEPHAQISRFFQKAVAAHRTVNQLDQFFSYTGDGSYSNSLTAWTPEAFTLREQMPGVFDHTGRSRFIRYNFSDYPKDDVINMLKRDDLDLTIFHEHGMPERQYLSGSAATQQWNKHAEAIRYYYREQARKRKDNEKMFQKLLSDMQHKYGLDSTWMAGWNDPEMIAADSLRDLRTGIVLSEVSDFKPNSKMVIFDACYNGDFREKDYIAGRYIMSEGKCVTTFANSVNVLQDKMANELLGLLAMGARVGQWAQLTNILESHITGDPTFRFQSMNEIDVCALLRSKYNESQVLLWLKSPYADIQNLALHLLHRHGYADISNLLRHTFETSPFMMVRYTSLALLYQLNDENFRSVLPLGMNDSYEFIRRCSVRMMQQVGLDAYVYPQVKAYVEDYLSERVSFNIILGLHVFGEKAVQDAIACVMNQSYVIFDKEQRKKALCDASGKRSMQKDLLDKTKQEHLRVMYSNFLRNYNAHASLDGLLQLLADTGESETLKMGVLDALAWFTHSYRKEDILQAARRISEDKEVSESLREQANRTYYRLKNY